VSKFEKGEQVVIIEDVRVMMGSSHDAVLELNGQVGRVTNVWRPKFPSHLASYDVVVGKRGPFIYRERSLRRASPLDLLAGAVD